MPETAMLKVLLSELGLVTVTVLVPPALPEIETSVLVKPLTGSLKTAVNSIGAALVGSFWPAFWVIVTLGFVEWEVTVLSVAVDALFVLPAASLAPSAGIEAMTAPSVMPETAMLKVLLSELGVVTVTVLVPPALPEIETSVLVKPLTGSLKTAVNSIGEALVGSFWPAFWLIVTLGFVEWEVTVLSVAVDPLFVLPAASLAPSAGIEAMTAPSVMPE